MPWAPVGAAIGRPYQPIGKFADEQCAPLQLELRWRMEFVRGVEGAAPYKAVDTGGTPDCD